jgi:putative membrane protein
MEDLQMVQMSRGRWSVVFGLLAMLGTAGMPAAQGGAGTPAQGGASTTQKTDNMKSGGDTKTFLTHAAQDGEAEIELGKSAQTKAADAKVKDFGARMQKDHSTANAELRAIIAKKGMAVPGGPGPHAAMKNQLDKLQGAAFDQAYMKAMVDDHTKAVREFEMASKSADADVQAFAAKTLPTLREHLRLAQEIHKGLGSTMRSSGTGDSPAQGTKGTAGTQPSGTTGTQQPSGTK